MLPKRQNPTRNDGDQTCNQAIPWHNNQHYYQRGQKRF